MPSPKRRRFDVEKPERSENGGRALDTDSEDSSDDEAEAGGLKSTGTVRLDIDRFSEFAAGPLDDKTVRLSAPVRIRGMPWRILAILRTANRVLAEGREVPKALGFWLECKHGLEMNDAQGRWSCQVAAQLRVVAQRPDTDPLQRKISHTFHAEENDWGYSRFVSCEGLLDETNGHIENDVVRLEVDFTAGVLHGFRSPRPTRAKKTVHRFELEDFKDRFGTATFGDQWEIGDFAGKGVPGARFFLRFCPKGSDEKWKNGCGFFLCIRDFGGHSFVRLQLTCWFENEKKDRFNERDDEHKFDSSNDVRGWTQIITQEKLTEFAQDEPLFACCEVHPFEPLGAAEWAVHSGPVGMQRKIAACFDATEFADVAVHVQERVFPVSKVIICAGSPVFRRMFTHDTKEKETGVVEIKKEDPDMIELLLRFLYSGKVEGLFGVADRLLPLADCYKVPELAKLCMNSLQTQLSISTVLRDLHLAFRHDHQGGFKRKMLAFAGKNRKAVEEHLDWTPQFVSENPEIAIAIVKLCPP